MRSGVPALAGGAVEGRRARGAPWSAALLSRPPYLSRAAGRGSLLPEEAPALSPAPPAQRPRGFVYRLGLFSEAPSAPALLAVAQPVAGGNLKPRRGAGAPTAPSPLALLPSHPAPRAQLLQPRERGRALGKLRPVLLQLPAWRGAGRGRPEWRQDRCGAGGGKKGRHPFQPRAVTIEPRDPEHPCRNRGPAQRGPEPGRRAQPPWPLSLPRPALGRRRGPTARREWGGGDSTSPHPAPELLKSLLSGLSPRWQRKEKEARRQLVPARWEWRAGTALHPTLGTLSEPRWRLARV